MRIVRQKVFNARTDAIFNAWKSASGSKVSGTALDVVNRPWGVPMTGFNKFKHKVRKGIASVFGSPGEAAMIEHRIQGNVKPFFINDKELGEVERYLTKEQAVLAAMKNPKEAGGMIYRRCK